ncbi:hypothetical protein MNBD_BACTEROID03-1563 [hydrothermal vent metagenome]|uniref:Glycosyl transferase family 1 domain-containing protein n=1 Tax=hydrothermal vent metagenome TaxID=652676 RepID=A0A3B0T034_9ZZZZ
MSVKIGFLSLPTQNWLSLKRTRKFYIKALSEHFKVIEIRSEQDFLEHGTRCRLWINFFGDLAWKFKNRIQAPVLFCLHGGGVLDYRLLMERARELNSHDGFIVNCRGDLKILKALFKSPPYRHLLPLPVSEELGNEWSKPQNKKLLSIEEDCIVMGFFARLLPQKNLHKAIILCHALRIKGIKIKLIIVGDYWVDYPILNWQQSKTSYRDYINDLIKDYALRDRILHFQSNLTDSELSVAYGALDFLYHPTHSLGENFGYAPVEAMKCGTPTLGNAYGGLKDSIISGETGYLIPTWTTDSGIRSDDNAAFTWTMDFCASPQLRETFSKQCKIRAETHYSNDAFARQLRKIVGSMLGITGDKEPIEASIKPFKEYSHDLLPDATPSWSYYRGVVDLYCSHSLADFKLSETCKLRAFSEFEKRDTQVKAEDPTWPLKFTLSKEEYLLLQNCSEFITLDALSHIHDGPLDKHIIWNLLHSGVLIHSQK